MGLNRRPERIAAAQLRDPGPCDLLVSRAVFRSFLISLTKCCHPGVGPGASSLPSPRPPVMDRPSFMSSSKKSRAAPFGPRRRPSQKRPGTSHQKSSTSSGRCTTGATSCLGGSQSEPGDVEIHCWSLLGEPDRLCPLVSFALVWPLGVPSCTGPDPGGWTPGANVFRPTPSISRSPRHRGPTRRRHNPPRRRPESGPWS